MHLKWFDHPSVGGWKYFHHLIKKIKNNRGFFPEKLSTALCYGKGSNNLVTFMSKKSYWGEKKTVIWIQVNFVNLAVELLEVSACSERVLFLCSSVNTASEQPVMTLEGQGSSYLCLWLHWCKKRQQCYLRRYLISEHLRKTFKEVSICILSAVFAWYEQSRQTHHGADCLVCPCSVPCTENNVAGAKSMCLHIRWA